MEDNEDEPEDVRKATPVAGEIESGRKDEEAGKPKGTSKKKDSKKPSRCEKDGKKPTLAKSEADCCRGRTTNPSKTPKMMSVVLYSPPCTLPRLEIIPRHCLSKQEYIDILAAPSRKCPPECLGKTVVRRIRPISARMNELAQPARRLLVSTLQERGETLPPEMISNLVKSIEGSACMTPEQAEKYFREKEREKERKTGKSHGRQKCKGKSKKDQCSSQLDKEAVMCQYMMAERFVKSILKWKCPIPVEEFQDIASVILRRLSFVLEYTPADGQDLKSQQMRFLADIIACWISGVLFEVAEEHKKEIEEELIAREEEKEEEEEEEDDDDVEEIEQTNKPGEETEEDDEEDEKEKEKEKEAEVVQPAKETEGQESGTQSGQDGDNQNKPPENPVVVKTEPLDFDQESMEQFSYEEQEEAEEPLETEAVLRRMKEIEERAKEAAEKKQKAEEEEARKKRQQEEEEENRLRKEAEEAEEEKRKKKEQEEEDEKRKKKEQEEEDEKRKKKEQEEEDEKRKKKEQEEEDAKRKKKEQDEEDEKRKKNEEAEAEENRKKKEADEQKQKKKKKEEVYLKEMGPKKAIEGIGDGELFKTDLPFVTFGKILDTVYTMLEDEPEGDETDIIHNRIQRSLYEKFARLLELEAADSLTENLKDVVDVFSGKAATWVKGLLKDSELKFMTDNPPEVESKEIRDWGKWIDQVTDRAGDWAEWIHRVVNEAEKKSDGIVNRGDWQDWTSDMETKALLWRRYYLETVHQAHHNKMMVVDRSVVKTGEKTGPLTIEEEINNTDLAA